MRRMLPRLPHQNRADDQRDDDHAQQAQEQLAQNVYDLSGPRQDARPRLPPRQGYLLRRDSGFSQAGCRFGERCPGQMNLPPVREPRVSLRLRSVEHRVAYGHLLDDHVHRAFGTIRRRDREAHLRLPWELNREPIAGLDADRHAVHEEEPDEHAEHHADQDSACDSMGRHRYCSSLRRSAIPADLPIPGMQRGF
jgi:hypothetical protein